MINEQNSLIRAIKEGERQFKSQRFSSVNELVSDLQQAMPERGIGFAYGRIIFKVVQGEPWQLDSNLPEEPLSNFLQQKAHQGDLTAQHLLKKMNLK